MTAIRTAAGNAVGEGLAWRPLAAVCAGYFMVILDVTVVTVAVPRLAGPLHTGVGGLQWVVDGYTLVFAGLLPLCGGLGDRLGARRVFLSGVALFVVASAGCAAAPGLSALVAARLVQGVGAALTVPASLALLRAAYPDAAARARAFGVWGGVAGIAAACGPLLGGVLVAGVGWRAVFAVNLPVGAAALAATRRWVPAPAAAPGRGGGVAARYDVWAQGALMAALVALIGALNEVGRRGPGDPLVAGGVVAAAAAVALFVVAERRAAAPMLPLPLLRRYRFAACALAGVLLNLGFYGLLFLAPLYFERVRGMGPMAAGAALAPMAAMAMLASPLSGHLVARVGPAPVMAAGFTLGACGFAGWLEAGAHSAYLALVAPMAASGFGMATAMPAVTAAIVAAVPAGRAAVASALLNTARQVGSALGVAVFGALVAGGIVAGLHVCAVVAAAAFLTGAVLSLSLRGGHHATVRPVRSSGG